MVRPVREKKPTKHYDPAKEAAKPQWKKPKKPKKPVHTYFISSDEEPEPCLWLVLRLVVPPLGRCILTFRIATKI